jgi:hypothetical protein
MAATKTMDTEVIEELRELEWEDNTCAIIRKLDRKLYVALDKVLKAAGGKWNRGKRIHEFDRDDAEEFIANIVLHGEYVDEKQAFQFFETPCELAERMLDMAGVNPGTRMLEPSAGKGAIAHLACKRGAHVYCIELNPTYGAELVPTFGVVDEPDGAVAGSIQALIGRDFLGYPVEHEGGEQPVRQVLTSDGSQGNPEEFLGTRFPAIVMNPPFNKSQDIAHVRHAYTFLENEGRLVAIMGPGWTFRNDRKATEFRDWLHGLADYEVEELPRGTFKEAGTMVSTVLVQITKHED